MRILYVYPESPLFPAWGIGTYLDYAAAAQKAAGHEIFLLTWTFDDFQPSAIDYRPFRRENVRILKIDGSEIWKRFPQGPWDIALSETLAPEIEKFIAEVQPEVVESTDYQAPLHGVLSARRAATRLGIHRPLFVTFCHGTICDKTISDAAFPPAFRWDEFVTERQVVRWADLMIAPSHHAARHLADLGYGQAQVIREPYTFAKTPSTRATTRRLVHLGHVSIGKGADLCVLFANLFDSEVGMDELVFIGSLAPTSFKFPDMEQYIRARLASHLRDKAVFLGFLPRDKAIDQVGVGDFGLNFRQVETFCYAAIETIDQGALPMVLKGTALAEFFPGELNHALLPRGFGSPGKIEDFLRDWTRNAADYMGQITAFNRRELAAERFAAGYERAVAEAKRRLPASGKAEGAKAFGALRTGRDVSILIPAKNPGKLLLDTVASIAAQTETASETIICDDGSDRDDARAVFAEVARKYPNIRVVRQTNLGLCGARNRLIGECKTSLAVFMDADDRLAPTYVEATLKAINHSEMRPQAVGTFRQNFGESEERVIRDNSGDLMHFLKNDFRMTALIELDALRALRFDPDMRNGEADDWDFWLRFRIAGYRFVLVPEFLFNYNFVTGSMSWPWSEGQTALTGETISRRFLEASQQGVLTEQEILLAHQIRAAIEFVTLREANTQAGDDVSTRPRDVLRLRRLLAAQKSGRWAGRLLYNCFKLVSGMARSFLR